MDINKTLKELKQAPGFTEHVGMMLVHNGVVRGWARKDHAPVTRVTVTPDRDKMAAICREMEQRPGIFKILAEAAATICCSWWWPAISARTSRPLSPNFSTASSPRPWSNRSLTIKSTVRLKS